MGKVLVKTGLLLHSSDAYLGLWNRLILLSTDVPQHSYLFMPLLDFGVCSYQKYSWCQFQM